MRSPRDVCRQKARRCADTADENRVAIRISPCVFTEKGLRQVSWAETRGTTATTKTTMSGTENGCDPCAMLKRLGLRPVTRCSLAKFYVPAFGAASYTAMSVNVMNPSLVIKVFPKRDITNFLLAGTLIGTASYIYTREHMNSATQRQKVLYSVTGAILLSLGSVLLWAVIRSIVPPNPACCTIAGVGSGLAFLKIGTSYLEFVDGQIAKK